MVGRDGLVLTVVVERFSWRVGRLFSLWRMRSLTSIAPSITAWRDSARAAARDFLQ
jgi:hypothetical protein